MPAPINKAPSTGAGARKAWTAWSRPPPVEQSRTNAEGGAVAAVEAAGRGPMGERCRLPTPAPRDPSGANHVHPGNPGRGPSPGPPDSSQARGARRGRGARAGPDGDAAGAADGDGADRRALALRQPHDSLSWRRGSE